MPFDWSSLWSRLTHLNITLSMNRLRAGLIAGAIGGVVTVILGFFADAFFCGPVPAALTGVGAGILISRNPDFAGKTGSAGAMAGLVAGVLLFIGQILAANVHLNAPIGHQEFRVLSAGATATVRSDATATAKAPTVTPTPKTTPAPKGTPTVIGGKSTAPPAVIVTYSDFSGTVLTLSGCIGLFSLGVACSAGALGGMLAGRNNRLPTESDSASKS